ncbi:MAG: hydrolase family protein [Sphingobacteriaceae bacterium]|nr:hydrolase family protein [Sphingobacteriaceae bacterium]
MMACVFPICCLAQKKQGTTEIIAATQADAALVFFEPSDPAIPVISPGNFNDPTECYVRDGLPHFLSKMRAKKPVRIAYLGGSITRSDYMYRLQSAKFIQTLFPGTTVEAINAGISGTDADLGACRLQEQVLKYNPDLLFIEFAVNGGFPQGVEGIIRQTSQRNPQTDICLIYTVTSAQLREYEKEQIPSGIKKLDSIANHYSIPSIHLAKEAAQLAKSGKLTEQGDPEKLAGKNIFSKDGVHPLIEGGNLYAAAIARSLVKMMAAKAKKAQKLPPSLFSDNWQDAQMLPPDAASFSSGWEMKNPDSIGFARYKEWFPYIMKAEKAGESFSFSFKGSMFGFFDIGGPEAGQLEMLVDGKSVKLKSKGTNRFAVVEGSGEKLNRFNVFCNDRYRGQFICIELKEGLHNVSFKISEEIPDKRKILGERQLQDISANPEKYNRSVIYLGKILLRGELIKQQKL